ncbi:auxin efflux carrier [Musa troglodytarum]|uniref:Auxin efflux carrier n=1 Tax=Musa troglodytarum TaxID=320322 RepID=A0A9E7HRA6_9LILI|nr:auxin efflux carrier [Musa troglodytarum]
MAETSPHMVGASTPPASPPPPPHVPKLASAGLVAARLARTRKPRSFHKRTPLTAPHHLPLLVAMAARLPCTLLLVLLLTLSFTESVRSGSLKPSECKNKCDFRCSATSHKKPCIFYCNKCCATCLCVPPGTHGNKEVCPCYNNWKTKEGGPKCP